MIIPREACLWQSVTFSRLEIVLFSLSFKKSLRSEGARVVIICHLPKKSLCLPFLCLLRVVGEEKRALPGS